MASRRAPASQTETAGPDPSSSNGLRLASGQGRWVLAATVLASGMAFLDGTVVNVALPEIGKSMETELSGLQWVLNSYLLATSALILLGGALGDMLGRRRMFVLGVLIFAIASAMCGLAENVVMLVGSRVLQGVGGALLTPGSLAILEASFCQEDRARAIGAWSGLTGVSAAAGPFIGGWLVDAVSWRWVFLLNLPLAAAVVVISARHVPESRNPTASRHIDFTGAVLIGGSLAALSWGLIAAGDHGWVDPGVLLPLVAGVVGLVAFVVVELREREPMVPPAIFAIAQFRAANLVTVAVYAGLGTVFFLLVLQLQQVLDYSALEAGAATLPSTILMLIFSSKSGQLASRIGPRLQMSAGPLVVAAGLVVLAQVDAGDHYVSGVLPGVLLIGIGLSAAVAPLTATALGSVEDRYAGVASGINTTVARAAQLAAVAAVPVLAGIGGDAYLDPPAFSEGYGTGMLIAAGLVAVGGIVGWLTVRNPARPEPGEPTRPTPATVGRVHCGVEGPPMDRGIASSGERPQPEAIASG